MKFTQSTKNSTKTLNHESRQAYALSPRMELVQRVSTWFVNEPKFYGDMDEETEQIRILIKDVAKQDPKFILDLAMYCRNELQLRSAPVFLLVEASLIDECKPFVRKYCKHIITRADQLAETLGCLQQRIGHIGNMANKGSMPAQLKRGLADTLINFSEFALAKYDRESTPSIGDVIKLTHPKVSEEKYQLFKKVIENTLPPADTWEVLISTEGSTKENWQKALPKMGAMALTRSLRKLLESGVDLTKAVEKFGNIDFIRKARQYPFRYLSAYNEVEHVASPQTSMVLEALSKAMDLSINNIPKLKGTTFVAIDHSPSMNDALKKARNFRERDSAVTRLSVANAMGSIINKISDHAIVDVFSTEHRIVNLQRNVPVLVNMKMLHGVVRSWGTDIGVPVHDLTENGVKVDRIIYLTDEEGNGEHDLYPEILEYRRKVNPNVFVYVMNLAGYGTSGIPDSDPKTIRISGFSEKIFGFTEMFESGNEDILKAIEEYAQSKL